MLQHVIYYGITYQAFGGIETLTYGNGITRTATHDTRYSTTGITDVSTLSYTYGYDANGNITAITNNLNSSKSTTFTYDNINRLSTANGAWGALNWTYDGTGNRLTENTNNYSYATGTNKLSSLSGPISTTFTYDSNGNTSTENSKSFTYNNNQRLIQATATNTGYYSYNAQGQRARKTVSGVSTYFIYDQQGQLIYESATSGSTAGYIYLNRQPIAKTETNAVYFIHTDHLGTPRVMTDSARTKVWEIETRPFGDNATITGTKTLNLRFPGQYYDAETGNHYNYFRDYDPNTGRYLQADPIGLLAGINLYVYVSNRPLNWKDPWGLHSVPKDDCDRMKCQERGTRGMSRWTPWVKNNACAQALRTCQQNCDVLLLEGHSDAEVAACKINCAYAADKCLKWMGFEFPDDVKHGCDSYQNDDNSTRPKDKLEPPPGSDRYPSPPGRGKKY